MNSLLYDPAFWSRLQFGFTLTYHYLFPQLTMGLAWFLVYWKWRALRTGEEKYNEAARFWAKIFGLNFAVGVVTGIPMEFQFGTNWADFSRSAGGVIGQTLAMEGMFAFFLESAFIGALIWGEKRLGPRNHFLAAIAVALGSWLSGYFILVTNAFMQHPVGYLLGPDGSGGLGSMAIQLLQTFGIAQIITTAGPEESVVYLTERFHLSRNQIIRYKGRSLRDLAAEAIEKNGGKLFTKPLDFVGGDMKRLCFDLVAFDGEIVSVVEEIDPFTVPLWHGRLSPLFSKSASFHFFSLGARGLYGGQESWGTYNQDLEHLLRMFEQRRLRPVKMENLGILSKETIARGHAHLESGLVQGKLIFTVG